MLCQKMEDNKERAIHYLNKMLVYYDTRYTLMEKICFAMIFTTEKLRYYLLYCTTYVIGSMNPLKYLMVKQHLLGRFAK